MNYGPLVFLAAFFALAASWFGFVLTPQVQVGQLQPTNTVGTAVAYPVARPGRAHEGLQVYRANGCAYCHSQQVGQTGVACDVMLTEPGTNPPALKAALLKVRPNLSDAAAEQLLTGLPKPVLTGVTKEAADGAAKALNAGGAKAAVWTVPLGPDIARGWGKRRTVAEDFLYDYPVMPGSQRAGPDLANVGVRLPDPAWHLRHLYAPRLEVKNSVMPPYRYLFQRRKVERTPSPDALALPPEQAPPAGYEIVPRPEAKALVTYLLSLRADAPLFATPMTVPAAAAASSTNAPAGQTNAPAGQTSAPAGPTNAPAVPTNAPAGQTNAPPPSGGGATNAAVTGNHLLVAQASKAAESVLSLTPPFMGVWKGRKESPTVSTVFHQAGLAYDQKPLKGFLCSPPASATPMNGGVNEIGSSCRTADSEVCIAQLHPRPPQ